MMKDFTSKDITLLEKSVKQTLEHGCKECEFRYIAFTTNVSLEPNGTKCFFLEVECPNCGAEYTDIMAMRDNND
mgnify:CR=1 FL=1